MPKKKPAAKPASVTLINEAPSGEIMVRISIQERVWYMTPDDARAAFIGLAFHYSFADDQTQTFLMGYDQGKEDMKRMSSEALSNVLKAARKTAARKTAKKKAKRHG